MTQVAVIGTTGWGSTLATLLAGKGLATALWARTEAEAQELRRHGENRKRLPGVPFPPNLVVTASPEEALKDSDLVLLAMPSQTMRRNLRQIRGHLPRDVVVLSAVKGLEEQSAKRMSQVIAEELDAFTPQRICVLSGPNLSREIARGLPAGTVVAAEDEQVAQFAQELLMTPHFRVYVHTDVIGVELAGALKNIIAIGAGICDGLELGDNAKAAFLTRGLAEITRLGVAAGAHPLTFSGLAGLGDLITTCASPYSRNRYLGQELAKGRPLGELLSTMNQAVEGVPTTRAARLLARDLHVDMPIAEQTYRVLFEGADLRQAIAELMLREAKHELAGMMERG